MACAKRPANVSNSESRSTSAWPGARTWRTSKLSGGKRYSTSPTSLMRDPVLPRIGNDEAGRRRPDMTGVAIGEIAALVHVAAGDQPQIDRAEHLDQPLPRRLRHVADRGRPSSGSSGELRNSGLCTNSATGLPLRARELGSEPVELLGLARKPGVHDQRIQPDKAPAGRLETPAVFADESTEILRGRFGRRWRRRRADRGRIVADVVIAGQVAAGDGKGGVQRPWRIRDRRGWSARRRRDRRC